MISVSAYCHSLVLLKVLLVKTFFFDTRPVGLACKFFMYKKIPIYFFCTQVRSTKGPSYAPLRVPGIYTEPYFIIMYCIKVRPSKDINHAYYGTILCTPMIDQSARD